MVKSCSGVILQSSKPSLSQFCLGTKISENCNYWYCCHVSDFIEISLSQFELEVFTVTVNFLVKLGHFKSYIVCYLSFTEYNFLNYNYCLRRHNKQLQAVL